MEPLLESQSPAWPFPFTEQAWAQTPPAIQAYVYTLHNELKQLQDRVETREARLQQHALTSSKPPSSDSPYTKSPRRTGSKGSGKAGGKPGHRGHRQMRLAPTSVEEVQPESCACGNTTLALLPPY